MTLPQHPIFCLLNLTIKNLSLHFVNLWDFFFQFIFLVFLLFYKIMRNSWPLNNMSSNCIDPLTCWFFSVNMTTVQQDLVSWILRCRIGFFFFYFLNGSFSRDSLRTTDLIPAFKLWILDPWVGSNPWSVMKLICVGTSIKMRIESIREHCMW